MTGRDLASVEPVLLYMQTSCSFGLTPRRATPETLARWKLLSPEPGNASATSNTAGRPARFP